MLTQIIVGETYRDVKYHGQVKYFIFECNECHKRFERLESYFSKQLKKRSNACCFCSPLCRARFINTQVKVTHVPPKTNFFKTVLEELLR